MGSKKRPETDEDSSLEQKTSQGVLGNSKTTRPCAEPSTMGSKKRPETDEDSSLEQKTSQGVLGNSKTTRPCAEPSTMGSKKRPETDEDSSLEQKTSQGVLGNSKPLDLVLSLQRWEDGGPDGQPVEDGLEVDAQAFLLDLLGDLRDRLLGG